LSNAVKFTPAGGQVRVIARLEGRSLAIEVSDTCVGVKQSDLPRLGDAFFQSGATGASNGEGTGLGLSIAADIVHAHGGEIMLVPPAADRGLGGATFRITLPPRRKKTNVPLEAA
jgi:signal transduction histidine kinase